MPRDAKYDSERILSHLDRVTGALERSTRTTDRSRALESQKLLSYEKVGKAAKTLGVETDLSGGGSGALKNIERVGKAVEVYDTAHSLYSLAKWSDPTVNAGRLIGKAGTKAFGEDSIGGMYAQHLQAGATIANAVVKPSPGAIAEAALESPNILKYGNPIYPGYQVAKKAVGVGVSAVKNAASETSLAHQSFTEAVRHNRGERQAEAAFDTLEHLSRVPAGGVGSAAIKTGAFGASVGMGFAAGGLGGAAGAGIVGLLAGPTLMRATERLREFSDRLHDSNSQFAEFSGGMSAVMAAQEARDIILSRERGDRRALSADYLAQGRHRLNQNMSAIEDLFATFKNFGTGAFDRIAAALTEPIADVAKGINKELNNWAKGLGLTDNDRAGLTDVEAAFRKGGFDQFGKPPRFNS